MNLGNTKILSTNPDTGLGSEHTKISQKMAISYSSVFLWCMFGAQLGVGDVVFFFWNSHISRIQAFLCCVPGPRDRNSLGVLESLSCVPLWEVVGELAAPRFGQHFGTHASGVSGLVSVVFHIFGIVPL